MVGDDKLVMISGWLMISAQERTHVTTPRRPMIAILEPPPGMDLELEKLTGI